MTRMTGKVKWPLVLATVLVMLMAFAGAALATNWPQFQFNERNTGTTSDSAPSLLPDNTWSQYTHSGGWSGIDTTPIVLGDHVYVLADDGKLYKFNKTGENAVWSAVVDENSGFQLATPATDGTNIYAAVNEFTDVIKNTNGNFQSNTNDWSTQTVAGSPEFSWDSTGFENGGCAKISETDASTNGEGYYYQESLNFSKNDKVRLYYAWKKGYETSVPAQQDIYITIEKPDGTTENIDSQTGVPAAYNTWYDVNKDVSSAFKQDGNYKIRLRYDYETTVGGKTYAWFDEVKLFKEKMKVKKVSNLDNNNPTVTTLFDPQRGQANTPVTYDVYENEGYIYVGSWPGNDNYGSYYCVKTSSVYEDVYEWKYPAPERSGQTSNGYYWAGAAVVGNYVVFGDDQSYLTVLNKVYGNVIDQDSGQEGNQPFDLLTIHNEDANFRQVRSSVHYDGGNKIYFTSRKYLWCFEINTSTGVLTHQWSYNFNPEQTLTYSSTVPGQEGGWSNVPNVAEDDGNLATANASGNKFWIDVDDLTAGLFDINDKPRVYIKIKARVSSYASGPEFILSFSKNGLTTDFKTQNINATTTSMREYSWEITEHIDTLNDLNNLRLSCKANSGSGWEVDRYWVEVKVGGCSTSSPVKYGDKVYAGKGSFGTGSGYHLYCVDTSGNRQWIFKANGGVQSSPVISSNNSLIYFTTNCIYGKVYCVNTSGTEQWAFQTNQAGTSGGNILQGVAASDGQLFFGNDGGYLYGIKRN